LIVLIYCLGCKAFGLSLVNPHPTVFRPRGQRLPRKAFLILRLRDVALPVRASHIPKGFDLAPALAAIDRRLGGQCAPAGDPFSWPAICLVDEMVPKIDKIVQF
jgi:hypothetical protein